MPRPTPHEAEKERYQAARPPNIAQLPALSRLQTGIVMRAARPANRARR
jgi:hypothetical protein